MALVAKWEIAITKARPRGDRRTTTLAETSFVDVKRGIYLTLRYIHTLSKSIRELLHQEPIQANYLLAEDVVDPGRRWVKLTTITKELTSVRDMKRALAKREIFSTQII